jgi:hypothetical protein
VKRFVLTVALASLAFAPLSVAQAQGGKPSRGGSGHSGPMSDRHAPTNDRHKEYKPSDKFGYGKHGYKSYSWTHSHWSEYYHRYCYYAPSYGWCFYEPTYSCYVPVSRFFEVYPEAGPSYAAPVSPAPAVTQQTTVVAAPAAPVAAPVAPPAIPVIPPPGAVQNTKVGAP